MTERPFCSVAARPILTAGLLRCACGAAPFAVKPGHDAMVGLDLTNVVMLFHDQPDEPMAGWCWVCWVRAHGGPVLAEAAD